MQPALRCILDRSVPVFAFLRLQGLTQTGVCLLPISPLIRYFGAFCYEYFTPPPGKDPIQPFGALIHVSIQRSACFRVFNNVNTDELFHNAAAQASFYPFQPASF
jgi:hypothetical protein